jgi:hypothetical protein
MKRASVVVLALLDRRQDVRRGFLRHALEIDHRQQAELVQIGRRLDDGVVHQLLDQLVAQALDVQRTAAGEMQQRLLALRRADQAAAAAGDGFVLGPLDGGAADRAVFRQRECGMQGLIARAGPFSAAAP